MVKMSLASSKKQATSCSNEFNNLKSRLDNLKKTVSKVQELNISGKAAQQAKDYTGEVVTPLISKLNDLIDTMEHDVKELPNKYVEVVDSKSWSSDELERKIGSCMLEIAMANTGIAGMSLLMKMPGQNNEDNKQCLKSMQKSKNNAEDKKKKYQKILKHLKEFDISSATIFNNVKDIKNAVIQGSKTVSKAKNFSIPSAKDLEWKNVTPKKDSFKKVKLEESNPIEDCCNFFNKIGEGMEKAGEMTYTKMGEGFDTVAKALKISSIEGLADEAVNCVSKFSPAVEKISKSVPVVGLMAAGVDGIQDFQKRKELGQSTTEALERTVISQVVQVAGSECVGAIAGLQGAACGALTGAVVTAPAGGEGAVPGMVIGGVAAYGASSIAFQNWAEQKLDSDIESE